MRDRLGCHKRKRYDASEKIAFGVNPERARGFEREGLAWHEVHMPGTRAKRAVFAGILVTLQQCEALRNAFARDALVLSRIVVGTSRIRHDQSCAMRGLIAVRRL